MELPSVNDDEGRLVAPLMHPLVSPVFSCSNKRDYNRRLLTFDVRIGYVVCVCQGRQVNT